MTAPDRPHRVRSTETWARLSEEYVSGVPAPELAERFGVGERTVRLRARQGGWRRVDQDDPEPQETEVDPAFADPDAPPGQLAEVCWRRMTAALSRGCFVEASRWEKFHRVYRTRERDLAREAERQRRRRNDDLYAEITKVTRMAEDFRREHGRTAPKSPPPPQAASHTLHGLHGVSDTEPPDLPEPADLTRAERRRRMKLAIQRTGKGARQARSAEIH